MIGVVTDSTAQLPATLADRGDVEVVAVQVRVGGAEFLDGVDIDLSWFHEQLADDVEVATSLPSPGAFANAYRKLEAQGVSAIVSIHVGSAHSGTVNAAQLAAGLVDVEVHVVDTGLVSFGISCCVLEAFRLIDAGVGVADLVRHLDDFAPTVRVAFLIQATEFVRSAGRSPVALPTGHDGVAVFGGAGSAIDVVGQATEVDDLAQLMVDQLTVPAGKLVVAVSEADPATTPFTEAMLARLNAHDRVAYLLRYDVTASVLAYTGLGTAGGYSFSLPDESFTITD